MHDNPGASPNENLLEELGYEPKDVDPSGAPKGSVIFFVWLGATVVVAWLFTAWIAPDMVRPPDATRLERKRQPAAPNPILQSNVTASKDIRDLRAREAEVRSTYGWTDRKTGHVRVPIDVATKRVLEAGLPSRDRGKSLEKRS